MIQRTNIVQVVQETPKRKSGFIGRTCLIGWISIFALIFVRFGNVEAQTFKNGGVYRNTGTVNCKEFQNYTTTAGTLLNSGAVNVTKTGTGNFLNDDGGSLHGTVHNYIGGTGAGTITCNSNTGNYVNGGGATLNDSAGIHLGTIQVQGALTSTGTLSTTNGTVEYLGNGAQTIFTTTYGILALSTSGTKSCATGTTIVNNSVAISGTAAMDVAGNTLTLNSAAPFPSGGTLSASATNSTVIYNASGAQSVHTATYYNLTLQNGGTKTADGSITVNHVLTNTVTFDLSTYSLSTGASASITNTGATIQTAGNVTFGATHTIAGTFIYQATTGTQSISTAYYSTLTLNGGSGTTGQKNFPTGTVGVSGTYSVNGANRSYGTGTFEYNGTAAQSVINEAYNNLTISTTGGYATPSAAIILTGNLVINSGGTLDMAGYTSSSFPGSSNNNAGTIRWSGNNVYVAGAGTTEFYGTGNGNVASGASNYGNLLFSSSGPGVKTFTSSITVTGNVTVNAGASVVIDPAATVRIDGNVNNTGIFTNNGTIDMSN